MALDEHLLLNKDQIFLRVYGWSPPAVSIGYGQSVSNEIDSNQLKQSKTDCVRRITGGRAVYHGQDFTYSFTACRSNDFGNTKMESYNKIADSLKIAMDSLKIKCSLEKKGFNVKREKDRVSEPCFSSSAKYELKHKGKKICGSAQREIKGRFIQHGSFVLDNPVNILDFIKIKKQCKDRYTKILNESAASLYKIARRKIDYKEFSNAIRRGFECRFGVITENYDIDKDDMKKVMELEKKYISDIWNKV